MSNEIRYTQECGRAKQYEEPSSLALKVMEADIAVVVCCLPLLYAGVDPVARMLLSLNTAFLSLLIAITIYKGARVPRGVLLISAGMLCLCIIQLLPLPLLAVKVIAPGVWSLKEPLIGGVEGVGWWMPLALSTSSAVLWGSHLASVLTFFIAASIVATDIRAVKRLLMYISLSAVFQLGYALLETNGYSEYLLTLPRKYKTAFLSGTFVNRDHFANFLALGFGASFGVAIAMITSARGERGKRLLSIITMIICAILGIAIIFTGCRGCTFAAGIGLTIGLATLLQGTAKLRGIGLGVTVAILVVTSILILASDSLFSRFLELRNAFDGEYSRPAFWTISTGMFVSSPIIGIGNGSFSHAFPAYEAVAGLTHADSLSVAHPHNDWLEWMASFGLAGVILGIALLFTWVKHFWMNLESHRESKRLIASGIAISVSSFALHAFVDFPYAIPATAITFSVIAGLAIPARSNSVTRASQLLSSLVFVGLCVMLSIWGAAYNAHGLSNGNWAAFYPGDRSDLSASIAMDSIVSGDYKEANIALSKAIIDSPADPYLWLSIATIPNQECDRRIRQLQQAVTIAPSSSYIRNGVVSAALKIRDECNQGDYQKIDDLIQTCLAVTKDEISVELGRMMLRHYNSFKIASHIADHQGALSLACAAFDMGRYDWYYESLSASISDGQCPLSDRRVRARFMRAPRTSDWLRFVSENEATIFEVSKRRFLDYILMHAQDGRKQTALRKAKEYFKSDQGYLLVAMLHSQTPEEAIITLSSSSDAIDKLDSSLIEALLIGIKNAEKTHQIGTIASALERLNRSHTGNSSVELALADAYWQIGKYKEASVLYENRQTQLSKERQTRLRECWAKLGYVEKLRDR